MSVQRFWRNDTIYSLSLLSQLGPILRLICNLVIKIVIKSDILEKQSGCIVLLKNKVKIYQNLCSLIIS